jgi:hypothetical protein
MITKEANAAHVKFMNDLKNVLAKNVDLSGVEMLAITSQFVGNLIAAQDALKYTSEQVMQMVAQNIEVGNHEALETAIADRGGSA